MGSLSYILMFSILIKGLVTAQAIADESLLTFHVGL